MKKYLVIAVSLVVAVLSLAVLISRHEEAESDGPGVGKVTAATGNVTILHAGVEINGAAGTAVYPDDEVSTMADSQANIRFADGSSFAIGENAHLSFKDFSYDKSSHSGKSIFTLAEGVFVYVSGLIGKDNPDNVRIETSAGSIGIRGTVVAGTIKKAPGVKSRVTVLDGAVTVTNGKGTLDLRGRLETAAIGGYDTAPVDIGPISTQALVSDYSSVADVAEDTLNLFDAGWYVGGTLQKATVTDWVHAPPEDQLATSADFTAALQDIPDIAKIRDKDKAALFKKQVIGMRACINQTIEQEDTAGDRPVAELVVTCAASHR